MDSAQYLSNQAQAQFPTAKREQIERLAKIKGQNAKKCLLCNELVLIPDNRENIVLCHSHQGLKSLVTSTMARRKASSLTPEDISSLIRNRTVSRGPYFRSK